MSAVDKDGNVQIVVNGDVQTLPYRRAVGLISLGRASWYQKPKPAKKAAAPKPAQSTVSTPAEDFGAESVKSEHEPTPTDQ